MGYLKIPNLYKDIRILEHDECYAMEKIHGTSAHIKWDGNEITLFSGGMKHETFEAIFDLEELRKKFEGVQFVDYVTIYGEACGGKQQKMSDTYGKDPAFIAFDVKVDGQWYDVTDAEKVVDHIGLKFVFYKRGPATVEWLNEQRDLPSQVALELGLGSKIREGVVIRPIHEGVDHRGNRIITKHKRDEFKETRTKREVDPDKMLVLAKAKEVAREWVTEMRLEHVLDKMPEKGEIEHTGKVIKAMINDVKLESEGEVVWSKAVEKEIGKETAIMYKKSVSKI